MQHEHVCKLSKILGLIGLLAGSMGSGCGNDKTDDSTNKGTDGGGNTKDTDGGNNKDDDNKDDDNDSDAGNNTTDAGGKKGPKVTHLVYVAHKGSGEVSYIAIKDDGKLGAPAKQGLGGGPVNAIGTAAGFVYAALAKSNDVNALSFKPGADGKLAPLSSGQIKVEDNSSKEPKRIVVQGNHLAFLSQGTLLSKLLYYEFYTVTPTTGALARTGAGFKGEETTGLGSALAADGSFAVGLCAYKLVSSGIQATGFCSMDTSLNKKGATSHLKGFWDQPVSDVVMSPLNSTIFFAVHKVDSNNLFSFRANGTDDPTEMKEITQLGRDPRALAAVKKGTDGALVAAAGGDGLWLIEQQSKTKWGTTPKEPNKQISNAEGVQFLETGNKLYLVTVSEDTAKKGNAVVTLFKVDPATLAAEQVGEAKLPVAGLPVSMAVLAAPAQ